MRTDAFDFVLPEEAIALRPARPRDAARLLVVGREGLADRIVRDLPEELAPGDLLVLNDTRVIRGQLAAEREAREGDRPVRVDLTLLDRLAPARWEALARPAKRLRAGDRLLVAGELEAIVAARGEEGRVRLDFALEGAALDAAVARLGAPPLPPYIARRRAGEPADAQDYQTVYARAEGAVAAPTAGLHFTPALIERLAARGVAAAFVTLHVGAGTFLPIKTEEIEAHRMHAERGEVSDAAAAAVAEARARGGRIVAVGTTSLRLLESAAGPDGRVRPFRGKTDIYITPGYRFRAVDRLMTNFHLPRSSLFVLVSAFAGLERMKAAYAHAVEAGYRFYSFGDACLLDRAGP
ncbi:MAG: tRNA preQ1(34) S-adenosylmethionine ribosyltransferase-isomerase QueA [Alphaproteobacteria bacterium]|nr:tRNA preQ1(34) S-adenosylmethionine ribosyltransferase-isomerase QueA [Alphaproteobacteria bacterium]